MPKVKLSDPYCSITQAIVECNICGSKSQAKTLISQGAISLNDRVQFINVLFNGDPNLFQQARAQINALETLDQAVEYITTTYNWDMGSQVVYRFMMAVRRKVR